MQNKYSDKIASLLEEKKREAKRHRSHTVRPEHLLMALLKQRNTIADKIMQQLQISKTDITIDCESQLLKDTDSNEESCPIDVQAVTDSATTDPYPDLDEKTNQLMRLAALEARMDKKETVEL